MKKVLITGGTGTVGKSFIKRYYNDYEFHSISRNETSISELKNEFPKVNCYIGNICNQEHMMNLFCKIKPEIVIHAAALKHINLAEENPSSASEINVMGSMNIIKASIRAKVALTVGVSTDKACNPDSVYGYSKRMMEKMFLEYHNEDTKFVCTRFANVANSNGSVIPFWISEEKKGNPLKLTDPDMNRLMFSKKDSAELIQKAISSSTMCHDPFILCKMMKNVNLLELAKTISNKKVEIIGKRPGEKLNETLISIKELPFTSKDIDGYVFLFKDKQCIWKLDNIAEEHSSLNSENMTTKELKELIWGKK